MPDPVVSASAAGASGGLAEPVLRFDRVSVGSQSARTTELRGVSFALRAGEIMLVEVEEGSEGLQLGDAALGIVEPDEGVVEFLGGDWQAMSPGEQAARRGRIGRVFEQSGWVGNLDVIENICLAQVHHTARRTREIVEEAAEYARLFGVAGIPDVRPSHASTAVLRRLEWARALLGHPALLVFERPGRGIAREWVVRLIAEARRAAQAGAAVLWTTCAVWDREAGEFAGARRFAMRGAELVPFDEGGS